MKITPVTSVSSKPSCIESGERRPMVIGALLVTVWLSMTSALADGPGSEPVISPTPASKSVRVLLENGLLSLHADQRPYPDVLDAIQKTTGIRFHHTIPTGVAVTESFTDLPVKQALQRLFGAEASLMFRYAVADEAPGPRAVPEEVWVIGTVRARGAPGLAAAAGEGAKRPGSAEAAGAQTPSPAPTPAVVPHEQASQEDQAPQENQALIPGLSDAEAIDSLAGMTRDEDPEMRLQALSALSSGAPGSATDTVRSSIDAALNDKDARVRGEALQALANLGETEAMPHLWQALRDPDPGVRILAIERAASGAEGKSLLEAALADEDESVRAVAKARLEPHATEEKPL